jgi:hypothetical protein
VKECSAVLALVLLLILTILTTVGSKVFTDAPILPSSADDITYLRICILCPTP